MWELWRSSAFGDCAILRGRMQSLLVGAPDWDCLEELSSEIEQGTSPCILEDFGRVLGGVLEYSLQWQRRALRDSIDPQGGDFRGSAIFENLSGLFWVY